MTLKDIAAECGVSMMTVSNVISGNHKKVSQATIQKVNEVIKKYDYVPNLMARTLSSKSSHLILLVIPYIKTSELATVYNQYLTELIASIERELMENGYYVLLRSVYEPKEIEVMYRTWNIDGAIFLLPFFNDTITQVSDYQKKNFVLIDSYADIPDVLYSRCDDMMGCYNSTDYLISCGHKKIAFAAEHEGNLLLEQRFSGYKKAVSEKKMGFSEKLVFPLIPNYEYGYEFGKSLVRVEGSGIRTSMYDYSDTFTALVTTSDMCALGIMEGARTVGLKIPEDFSIIGFDNLSICNFTNPRLTSVDQQTSEKGKAAVKLLLQKLSGKEVEQKILMTETRIAERESVLRLS